MAWRSNVTRDNLLKLLGYEIVDKSLVHTPNDNVFVLCDVETTGLDSKKDRVIQISGLRCKYNASTKQLEIIEELDQYIKPEVTISNPDGSTSVVNTVSDKITELTGITNEMLAAAPLEGEVFEKIETFFGEKPIFVAYNSRFDKGMIMEMFIRNSAPFIIESERELDVLVMARDLVTKEEAPRIVDEEGKSKPSWKLGLIAQLYGVDKVEGMEEAFHSSIFDTKVMRNLLNVFINEYIEKLKEELDEPPVEKKRARVEGIKYWAGYRGYSRLYINCRLDGERVSFFYDIRGKVWGEKQVGIIDRTLMEEMKADALELAGCADDVEFARVKTDLTADATFLSRYDSEE